MLQSPLPLVSMLQHSSQLHIVSSVTFVTAAFMPTLAFHSYTYFFGCKKINGNNVHNYSKCLLQQNAIWVCYPESILSLYCCHFLLVLAWVCQPIICYHTVEWNVWLSCLLLAVRPPTFAMLLLRFILTCGLTRHEIYLTQYMNSISKFPPKYFTVFLIRIVSNPAWARCLWASSIW